MSSNSFRGGSFYSDVVPYRSRDRLTARIPVAPTNEIQLCIDPVMEFDDEIIGLHGQVRRLRNVMYASLYLTRTRNESSRVELASARLDSLRIGSAQISVRV
ncbi:unnamed protein product [Lathyrus sativus]|nr:unnamed protein product [Lathyrus sativus]